MIELSDREKACLVVSGGLAFSLGMWVGIWLLPSEALSVPTTTEHGDTFAAYTPVPNFLPVFSLAVTGISLFFAYAVIVESADEPAATPATDGGQEVSADD